MKADYFIKYVSLKGNICIHLGFYDKCIFQFVESEDKIIDIIFKFALNNYGHYGDGVVAQW